VTTCAARRPIILEACLHDILISAGVDLDDLRSRVEKAGVRQFRTMWEHPSCSRLIEDEGLPRMRGAINPHDDGDELTAFELDLGHGSSYRGMVRNSSGRCSHVLVPGRFPETAVLALVGEALPTVLAHPWITDHAVRIASSKKLADGVLLDIESTWRAA